MKIDRSHYLDPAAISAAKLLLAEKNLPEILRKHAASGQVIAESVKAGWFLIPAGRNGKYTCRQFQSFHKHLSAHPSIPAAQQAASDFMRQLKNVWAGHDFELFGSTANKRFSSPAVEAKGLAHHCPRMPLGFKAGDLGVDSYLDLMDDISNNCSRLMNSIKALSTPDMLNPAAPIEPKVSALLGWGQGAMVVPLLHSVHKMYLGLDGERELKKVIYQGNPIQTFFSFIERRNEAHRKTSEAAWAENFKKISRIADVMSDARSYHQGAMTRELRDQLGSEFGIVRIASPATNKLVIEMGAHLRPGESSMIQTVFELANWAISLNAHLVGKEKSIYGYLSAVERADSDLARLKVTEAA